MTTPNESPPPPMISTPTRPPIATVSADLARSSALARTIEGLATPTRLAFLGVATLVGLRIVRSVEQSGLVWAILEGGAAGLALASTGEMLARLWMVLARWSVGRERGEASVDPNGVVVHEGLVSLSSSRSTSPSAPPLVRMEVPAASTGTEKEPSRLIRVERAIETRDWALVVQELAEWQADSNVVSPPETLLARWRTLRQNEARRLLGRIEASRQARDLEGVLEDRRALEPLLDPNERTRLTRDLAGWALRTFQERLRGGLFSAETATLAARLAEEFGETPEGASLRASLPTLRRAARLCPRCAGPYDGVEDRCPRCVLQEVGETAPAVLASPSPESDPPASLNGQPPPGGMTELFESDDDWPPITSDSSDDPYFLDPDADLDADPTDDREERS